MATYSGASASTSTSQQLPEVNVIPASPISPIALGAPLDTHTMIKNTSTLPSESETALVGDGVAGPSTDVVGAHGNGKGRVEEGIDTRNVNNVGGVNGSSTPIPDSATPTATTSTVTPSTPIAKTAPAPAKSTIPPTSTTTKPTPSNPATKATLTPHNPPTRPSQKKKRKRKGLAGLLLSFGCLSANDFEDENPAKTTMAVSREEAREMAQKVGSGGVSSTRLAEPSPPASPEKKGRAGTAAVGGAVVGGLVGAGVAGHAEGSKGATGTNTPVGGVGGQTGSTGIPQGADVVVAPVEPVTLPVDETAGLTSSAVQPPGSGAELLPNATPTKHRTSDSSPPTPGDADQSDKSRSETSGGYSALLTTDAGSGDGSGSGDKEEYALEEEYEDEEDRLIAQGGIGIPVDAYGNPAPLLPVMDKVHEGRKCLVLDLDETLLHSSFKMLPTADFIVPVEIESQVHNVYVIKRPGVDQFLKEMGKIYEVVVFTASLSKYADPVMDMLDIHKVIRHRLFRESCYNHKGNYVKDLSQLGRAMDISIIIDNSPASYIFHPNNAVPVSTWFNDPHDTELTDLVPFLTDLATVDDVRGVLDGSV